MTLLVFSSQIKLVSQEPLLLQTLALTSIEKAVR